MAKKTSFNDRLMLLLGVPVVLAWVAFACVAIVPILFERAFLRGRGSLFFELRILRSIHGLTDADLIL